MEPIKTEDKKTYKLKITVQLEVDDGLYSKVITNPPEIETLNFIQKLNTTKPDFVYDCIIKILSNK